MKTVGAVVFLPRETGGSARMLEDLVLAPAALWLAEALKDAGVGRFFVVCHEDDRERAAACFPQGTPIVTSGTEDAFQRLGDFLAEGGRTLMFTRACWLSRAGAAQVTGDGPWLAGPGTGIHRIDALALKAALEEGKGLEEALRGGEEYPRTLGGVWSLDPRDSREERDRVSRAARADLADRLYEAGVRFTDADSVYLDPTVTVGAGTCLLPGTILTGRTAIGRNCVIGPNSIIRDCLVGDGVKVNASQLSGSVVEDGAELGPFACVRPGCRIGRNGKAGSFVELKNADVGADARISPLTYVGDADVGSGVDIGCGTVTVNYDGDAQFRTVIGDGAFVGCSTNLVAPVKVGEGAYTAAGSTITEDVPADSLAIARDRQVVKKQWAAKRRNRRK